MSITDAKIETGKLLLQGRAFSAELDEATVSGTVNRTIEGASTLSLTVVDPGSVLLSKSFINSRSDIRIEGMTFRLVQVRKADDVVTLVFESLVSMLLRGNTSPRKALRSTMTRAEFVRSLVRADAPKVKFICPELRIRQPIEKIEDRLTVEDRQARREFGFAPDVQITFKNVAADAQQIDNALRVLDTGVSLRAPRKLLVCSMMTITQESVARNLIGGDLDSVGVFQQRKSEGWPATRVIETDAAEFFRRALVVHNDKPNLAYGVLCQAVQNSRFPDAYASWRKESEATVAAYMGATGETVPDESSREIVTRKFEFRRGGLDGEKETTWDAAGRLADEVQWRWFVSGKNGDAVYFISDKALMASAPRMRVTEHKNDIQFINYDVDANKDVNTANFVSLAEASVSEPGSVIEIYGTGVADGRWLIASWERDIWSPFSTTNLTTPEASLPEPAPEEETVSVPITGGVGGANVRLRVVNAAKRALENKANYTYAQVRPMAPSLFDPEAFKKTDCSSFAILCYKAAKAPDPSGNDYNGSGNTASMAGRGRKTDFPEPGDLVFYGVEGTRSAHVSVYIGDDECIGFGSTPIKQHKARYRTDFREFRTYLDSIDEVTGEEIITRGPNTPDLP